VTTVLQKRWKTWCSSSTEKHEHSRGRVDSAGEH